MKIKFILYSLILTLMACEATVRSNETKESIKKFDEANKYIILDLCDSLKKNVDSNRSFYMETRREIENVHFIYIDSSGKVGG